jgi:uncharacterized protein (DUF3820 family)
MLRDLEFHREVMMDESKSKIIPFGKYKGRLIDEVLIDDPNYLQWLAGQDWFRAKFVVLHQVIINRGAPAEETPEHNALQVRFLDDAFCRHFMRRVPAFHEVLGAELRLAVEPVRPNRAKGLRQRLAARSERAPPLHFSIKYDLCDI